MARFTDKELEHLKANTSLLRLAQSQGHVLKKEGKDYVMRCPFHEDKTPSLKISPDKNLFHCFGCGAAGSVIDWVMKTHAVSFRHAVTLLKDRSGSALAAGEASDTNAVKHTTVRRLASPLSENADQQSALQAVIAFYHQTLKDSPDALDYLRQRGLDSRELIDTFKLGYANRTLGLHLPQKNRKAGKAQRELLQAVGIYRASGHEHFNGSLVIPVINQQQVLEVYGRKLLGGRLRKGTPQHLYLPGEHHGVFNLDGLGRQADNGTSDEVILCESLIDALTFWRWGFTHVTCSYGTHGFTDELLQCFIDKHIKRVLIAYDRDRAGNSASDKLAKKLNEHGIEAYRLLFPKNTDANEYALQVQPAQKALALVIRKAELMGKAIHATNASTTLSAGTPTLDPLAASTPKTRAKLAEQALDTQASPVPKHPTTAIELNISAHEINLTLGDRAYRIKGFDPVSANPRGDSLKINLMVSKGEHFHLDKLDLYLSKQRHVFINQAAVECGVEPAVIKTDLGHILLQLEGLQQQHSNAPTEDKTLSHSEREQALSLLKDKHLVEQILADFTTLGVVGEETNKLVGYLACVSRKLDKPLALMVQSTSAAGKSALMEAIVNLMPEDERVQYSAMTGQSLFYMGETNLKHKILAISEEEGAHNASYALKLLQSEGEVTIASTGKDDSSGDLVTKEYRVEGPVMLFMTTTAIDIDEELLNRCLVLTVNESRAQTQAIHQAQRKRRTLEGLQSKLKKQQLTQLHRHAQQLLKPLAVINPYADQLTFLDDKTRTRRDHEKYLTLIDSIALLHQYQREIKTIANPNANPNNTDNNDNDTDTDIHYIEVEANDIALANQLAHEILGRSLDELPPQTRKLLTEIQHMVTTQCERQSMKQSHYRFSRKTIRDATGWSDGQLKIHCKRLEELEYLLVHRGGRGMQLEYELLYTGDSHSDKTQMMGLLAIDQLTHVDKQTPDYDDNKLGQKQQKTASSQRQVSPKSDTAKGRKAPHGKAYRETSQATLNNAQAL